MSDYYGVNRSDEYLEHWGIPKGGQRKSHKYIMRVKSGSGWRYLYTPAEVAAYGKEKITTGAKTAFRKLTAKSNNTLLSRAAYGVKRIAGLFKDANANGLPRYRHQAGHPASGRNLGRLGTEAVQSHLKKSHPGTGISIRINGGGSNSKDAAAQPFKKSFGRFEPRGDKDKTSKSTGIVGKAAGKVKSKVLKAAGAKNSKASAFKAADKRVADLGRRSEYDRDERLYSGFKKIKGGRSTTQASQKATKPIQWRDRVTMPNQYEWTGKKLIKKAIGRKSK